MLTDNDVKEELSYAFLHAIAAHAGFSCMRPGKDRDSVDAVVEARGKLTPASILRSPALRIQLKATVMPDSNDAEFPFDLPIKNYNDLRQDDYGDTPRLLVVYDMPELKSEWLNQNIEDAVLNIKRCLYWHNLKGYADVENSTSKRIQISRSNILSPDSLKEIMTRISREEEIGNEI
jgi:hypothetical protein